jgi:hypothetical protein
MVDAVLKFRKSSISAICDGCDGCSSIGRHIVCSYHARTRRLIKGDPSHPSQTAEIRHFDRKGEGDNRARYGHHSALERTRGASPPVPAAAGPGVGAGSAAAPTLPRRADLLL